MTKPIAIVSLFIFLFFLLSTFAQLFIILGIYYPLCSYKSSELKFNNQLTFPSVSIVVCAHNELEQLKKLIPILLSQNHQQYEVIVVDDRSDDGTEEWLRSIGSEKLKYTYLKSTLLGWNSKKFALHQGISRATNDIILLTDADCIPSSSHWLTLMTKELVFPKEASIGYAPYLKENTFLNRIIRFETLMTAVHYFSIAIKGLPYMGVGRNMAYSKQLFEKNNGVEKYKNLMGGDDDLFAQTAFSAGNTVVQLNPLSFVYSVPKRTYFSWFHQKTRHLNVGKNYSFSIRLILGLIIGSYFSFYLSFFTLLCLETYIGLSLMLFIFRTFLLISIFVRLNSKFKEDFKWYWIPILDAVYIFNYMFIGINTYFFNRNKWK
ncbi:MAG: glycosyltransferase [Cytophagales bacterium]|nr:MAG: glycosyltransferase [Cytophagales bacterium]